jgi:hypothetical protein
MQFIPESTTRNDVRVSILFLNHRLDCLVFLVRRSDEALPAENRLEFQMKI